jgi:predicted MPP superfamily phosphohydrolase
MLKNSKMNRRRFLAAAVLFSPLLAAADAKWIEPGWLKVRRISLTTGKPGQRLVQVSDIHHKGDRALFGEAVRKINELAPDAVFFTGDLIEHTDYQTEALGILSGIKSPVYGVPGNHDFWSGAPWEPFRKTFSASGGRFLMDEQVLTPDGKFAITGVTCHKPFQAAPKPVVGARNIFLMHYPAFVKKMSGMKQDLILAGHSHGGQVRLPLYGSIMVPFGVDEFDMGMFQTPAGNLYVNPGIGWYPIPLRFNCRPEITVFEI